MTSLVVGLLLKKIGRPQVKNKVVTIYEMSGEIICCLQESAVNLDLVIDCFQMDFRDQHPELYLNQFDVVFVDPPYTLSGLKLFLSRAFGVSRLDTGMICLSFGKKAPSVTLTIQELKQKGYHKCGERKFLRQLPVASSSTRKRQSLGDHYLLELNNCSTSLLSSVMEVEKVRLKIVKECHLTAINHCFHQFKPRDVSGVVILAESHFTIHT